MQSSKRRSIWLGVNLVTVFIAVFFISLFEATLQEKIALAILMPVVASMGGIAGTQTLILVTRGIKTTPAKAAKIKLTTIAKAMTMLSNMSANHKCVATPITNAQIKPFNKPIATSLFINTLRLEFVILPVAIPRVTKISVCVPAIPPIDATTGIKIAR
jgi:hypothetical protein